MSKLEWHLLAFKVNAYALSYLLVPDLVVSCVFGVEEATQIESYERYITLEHVHVELSTIDDFTLTNLDKATKFSASSEASVEQITAQRVENNVDSLV